MEENHQQVFVGIQRDHQLAITDPENRIETIQYGNIGLHGDIGDTRQTVTDLAENKYAPRVGKYDNVHCMFEKNQEDEMDWTGEHPYYLVRCEKWFLLHTRSD